MRVELEDTNGSRFVLEEVETGATRREWLCPALPSGGGLRVSLTTQEGDWARKHVEVTEAVIEEAIKLAVASALRQRRRPDAPGRDVVVTQRHLRKAASQFMKVEG
jgi:hypothetical protein